MRKTPSLLFFFSILFFYFVPSSPAPIIFRPGEGFEVEGQNTVEENSTKQLEKAAKFEKESKLEEAYHAYRSLVKTWPLSPNSPEAQYRAATMLYKLYDFQRAYKEFQRCVEDYPDSEHFNEILKYQYDIACLFLLGERQKLWKIPTLPSMDKAVEMFEQVIKNGPYSQVAPLAQLKIGFAREKQHQWEGAVKAYQDLIRKYPKSDLADDAQFQIGYAYMMASKEADYDQTYTNRSIIGFQDYITKYPKSEKLEQANENLHKLKQEQARGLMRIAEFYDGNKKYESALIYYNLVIQRFPKAEVTKQASIRADELKKIVPSRGKEKPTTPPASSEVPKPAPISE
jgi:outer membrane protein assembly factor BamD